VELKFPKVSCCTCWLYDNFFFPFFFCSFLEMCLRGKEFSSFLTGRVVTPARPGEEGEPSFLTLTPHVQSCVCAVFELDRCAFVLPFLFSLLSSLSLLLSFLGGCTVEVTGPLHLELVPG